MYVLKHSKDWWNDNCKIKCPDCKKLLIHKETPETYSSEDEEMKFINIDIIDQEYVFWKHGQTKKYDIQYHATFKCLFCHCVFKAWSHIVKEGGPPISMYNGEFKKWNGYCADGI